MFKLNNKDTRTMSLTFLLCFFCWLWTYFTLSFRVSIVAFEHVFFFFAGYKTTLEQKVLLKVHMFKVRMAMVTFCQRHFHRLQKYLSRCLLVQIQQ